MRKISVKIMLTLFSSLVAQSTLAQSQVTIYGILDSGLVHTTNSNAGGDSITKVPGLTSSVPSRLGFRGTEELGGGVQALFVLETGINLDTGTLGQGNRLFGRQAFVGLKGGYGTIMLGRQVNMTFLAAAKSDVMGPNIFSMSSIDPYIPNARSDNAVGYIGNFGNFTVGATYSFGRDTSTAGGAAATGCPGEVSGNSEACRQVTALLGYDNKNYGVTMSFDRMNGNVGAAAGMTTPDSSDRRTTLNAYAMIGKAKIGAGVMDREKKTALAINSIESELSYVGASYPLTPFLQLDGQIAHHDIKGSSADSTLYVIRGTYNLSKRTALHSSVGRMNNEGSVGIPLDVGGTVGVGMNQSGVAVGLRHAF